MRYDVVALLKKFKKRADKLPPPMVTQLMVDFGKDPFIALISCLLSLRARDTVTYPICKELFRHARTPRQLLAIPISKLEKMIHSIGFYKRKARILHEVCEDIITRFKGKVPAIKEKLLSIKHVGQKTANIVLAEAFDIPALAVDTHVHRISNKLGLVHTKTADQTEKELLKIIPKRYWAVTNRYMVVWGQNRCKDPKHCPVHELCAVIYGK